MTPTATIGPADAPIATLYLGDAYAIRPALGWMDADVMDPPYLFRAAGGGEFRKNRTHLDQIVAEGLDQGFDHQIINPLQCGSVVVFCHNDQLPDLLPYLNGLFHRFCLLGWIKTNPSPVHNKHYLPDVEPFIHAWNRDWHPRGEHHDKHRWVSAYPMKSAVFGHPTVKPAKVMDKIIANVAGRTICDPFMGTGSTGVAAIKAGRRFIGIERSRKHFDTAVERLTAAWQQLQERQAAA